MVLVDFCALGGRCARRDWHTGKRKAEGEGGEVKILGFGPWSLVLLQDPAARRATLVDRLRDGQDDEQGHAVEKLAEWDDFGAHFGSPLDRIGIPACVF